MVELADAWVSGGRNLHYSSGAFSVLAGALISFQTAFVFSGLLMLDERGAARRRRRQRDARRSRGTGTRQPAVGLS